MSRTIEDLREQLFDAIAAVKAGTLDVDQAKIISDLAQVMVNSAKVEVDYRRVTDANEGTKFLTAPGKPGDETPGTAEKPNGITGIVRHRLKG